VIVIDRVSPNPDRPFANLLPILDLLLQSGNKALDGGFILIQDGWRCRLRDPVDFEAIRRSFQLPDTIVVSERYDSVLDENSWCSLEGPNAHA
jgi:nitrogen fixation protein